MCEDVEKSQKYVRLTYSIDTLLINDQSDKIKVKWSVK